MNGTPAAAARRCSSLHVLCIALLVEHQQRGVLRERARGDQPPSGGRLTGARRAEQHDVLAGSERQPRSLAAASAHRHVLDARRPRPLVHELPLRAQILPLARRALGRRLPQPPPRELVISQLLPAPRSTSRQRRPTAAAATQGAPSGSSTASIPHARTTTHTAIAAAITAAGR